jgi:quinoprotein glucose dehydrogenase
MLPRSGIGFLLGLSLALSATSINAASMEANLVHDSVAFPSTIRFAPDGRLFMLETFTGRVMVYADTLADTASVWATLPVYPDGERGLLGLAFHLQFPDSPYVYLYYTNASPLENRLVRMRDSSGVGVGYTILVGGLSALSSTHQGGRLAFGPDGMLYMTVGDQFVPANAQDVSLPYGKVHRLTSMGRPAPGNPFGPGNPEVTYGNRNDFGLCFDPLTGQGYFTENGPDCDDELNFLQFAANYGWGPNYVCGAQPAGTKLPMWSATPTVAPTGICMYRGALLPYDGSLFFGTFNAQSVYRAIVDPAHPDAAISVQPFIQFADPVLDVIEGQDQRLWVATTTQIWRIGPPPPPTSVGPDPIALHWGVAPNPFRSRIALAASGGTDLRRIEIFDLAGRRVRRFEGPFHDALWWDGSDANGRSLPAGVFLVRAESATGVAVRRVIRLGA